MDNRINDTATPGCSHWAALPAAEVQPVSPSLQALTGIRNTAQNIQSLPGLVRGSAQRLYLTPPQPGYKASEQVVANQLRSLVMSMEQQPSADTLAQATGVSESMAQQILMLSSTPRPLPHPSSTNRRNVNTLNILIRKTLAKEDGRVAALRTACPRLLHEEDRDYAYRLALKSKDPAVISELSGVTVRTAQSKCRTARAENDGRAEHIRQTVTRKENEPSGDYARRLVPYSRDDAAISAASGVELGSVMWIRRQLQQQSQ